MGNFYLLHEEGFLRRGRKWVLSCLLSPRHYKTCQVKRGHPGRFLFINSTNIITLSWSCFCGIRCCSTVSKRTKGQFRPHKQHQPYSLNKAAQLLLLLCVVHLDFNLGYATNTDYDAVTVTLRLGVMGFPATGYFICQKLHHITESTFQECSIQIKGTVFQTHCIFRRAQKISKMEG